MKKNLIYKTSIIAILSLFISCQSKAEKQQIKKDVYYTRPKASTHLSAKAHYKSACRYILTSCSRLVNTQQNKERVFISETITYL